MMTSSRVKLTGKLNQILSLTPVASNIVPYLELSDIPVFARLNKSTASLIHSLNNSTKFKRNSGISHTILKSLQRDAKQILDDPEVVFSETDEKLSVALKSVLNGKMDNEILAILRTQKLKYRSQFHTNIYGAAGKTATAGLDLAKACSGNSFLSTDAKASAAVLLGFLFLSLILAIFGALYQCSTYCINECRSRNQERKLRTRLAFFKDLPDEKEEIHEKTSLDVRLQKL